MPDSFVSPVSLALPQPAELTIGASGEEVRRASDWLDAVCQQRGVPPPSIEGLVLCLNEVLANVIAHGGNIARSAPIALRFEVSRDRGDNLASVAVSDTGMPFNPLTVSKRRLPKTLADAEGGGFGLVMIRRYADRLDYRHEAGRNHFTFGVRWKPQ